jgi:hypothetical protein
MGSIPMHFRHTFNYINKLAPCPAPISLTGRLQNLHICISTEKFNQAVFLTIRDQFHHKLGSLGCNDDQAFEGRSVRSRQGMGWGG